MRISLLLLVLLFSGCSGSPAPPDWQLHAYSALGSFQSHYLQGNTRSADLEFKRLKDELSATGRPGLIARAELQRCALRTAALEFDDCPAFEALRGDAGPEEVAYAEYLGGRGSRSPTDDPISKLVSFGVQFKTGKATPETVSSAVELSSEQGWRRPLLAWLGVQAKRAEAAGDQATLERIRRRMTLVAGEK